MPPMIAYFIKDRKILFRISSGAYAPYAPRLDTLMIYFALAFGNDRIKGLFTILIFFRYIFFLAVLWSVVPMATKNPI